MKTTTRTMRLMNTSEGRLLRLQNGEQIDYYRLTPLASYQGRAVRLQKVVSGSEEYDVLLDGERSTCECMGFLRHGRCKDGKGCKHLASLTKLQQLGKL